MNLDKNNSVYSVHAKRSWMADKGHAQSRKQIVALLEQAVEVRADDAEILCAFEGAKRA